MVCIIVCIFPTIICLGRCRPGCEGQHCKKKKKKKKKGGGGGAGGTKKACA